ncbi:histidine triad nucleotide-binding protein [Allisonella histaminiformans]|uniref:histidine triad nucleotide-binding protein n=1 Tax=Allisonella histaminiformans TaxID=209880 RepID=UPI002E78F788|nr:histidine triad nucleotide-binding protein [Allisonella histaminiformans]
MEDCLFCKRAAGDLPRTTVYEDDHCFAFRDINPSAPVHVLLIPRQHVKNILALTDETNKNFSDFFLVVKKIAEQEGLGDNGFRLVINTGAEAGQTVFHFHAHIIGGKAMGWPPFPEDK